MTSVIAPRDQIRRTVEPLSVLSFWWSGVALGPLIVTLGALTMVFAVTRGNDAVFPAKFPLLIYGLANLAVLIAVYIYLPRDIWRTIALVRSPSKREFAAGMLATVIGVVVGWPLTALLADAGQVPRYTPSSITSITGLVVVVFGSVVVAPIVEEVLFRGLLFGILVEREYGPIIAGGGSLLLFAGIHVFTAGIAGVVNAVLLGALLTWLRLRFDNLVGAWLMHLMNNLLELLVAVTLIPSLYAI